MREFLATLTCLLAAVVPTQVPAQTSVEGSVRARFETLDGRLRANASRSDQQLATRINLIVSQRADRVSFTGELMDSRVFHTDAGSRVNSSMANAAELVQAYVAYAPDPETRFVAGRYTLDLGTRRLVGRARFRNTTNSFLGLLAEHRTDAGVGLTAFLSQPAVILPLRREALIDHQIRRDEFSSKRRFWGVEGRGFDAGPAKFDAYLLGLRDESAQALTGTNRELYTLGARLQHFPAGSWQLAAEAAYQWGERRQFARPDFVVDVRAELFHLEARREFGHGHMLRLSLDWASGDRHPDDDQFDRFDSLFGPSVPDFAYTGIYGAVARANLLAPEVRWTRTVGRSQLLLALRPIWLASESDAFGRTGVRDPEGASGRFAATQLHGRLRIDLAGPWAWDSGFAVLEPGSFLERASDGAVADTVTYTYGMLSYRF